MVKLPLYRHTAGVAALASLIAPACCYIWHMLDPDFVVGRGAAVFWPTLRIFAGLIPRHEVGEYEAEEDGLLLLALFTNALVYVVVFSAVWTIVWLIRSKIKSTRHHPTI
jgi:hypothetical protein